MLSIDDLTLSFCRLHRFRLLIQEMDETCTMHFQTFFCAACRRLKIGANIALSALT